MDTWQIIYLLNMIGGGTGILEKGLTNDEKLLYLLYCINKIIDGCIAGTQAT